jgi:uncharacterized LabA/DUF88 family protein
MTSYELRQVANRFTDLADILDKIWHKSIGAKPKEKITSVS